MNMLKQIVQANGEIMVAGVQEGSTIITLEMGMDDIERLIDAFTSGRAKAELDAFRVARLKRPDSEDFTLSETVVKVDEGTTLEEPLRGRVYRRALPAPAPKPPPVPDPFALPEKPQYDLPKTPIKQPVPQRKPTDTDADE